MWPAFVVADPGRRLILHRLPPVGTGVDLVPAILLATFGNLVLIGAVAPWLARRIWATAAGRRPRRAGRWRSARC